MIELLTAFYDIPLVHYVVMGSMGGLAYCLVSKFGWKNKADFARRVILGGIVGVVVYLGDLPNFLTAFGLGYLGIDGIEAVLERIKARKK